MRVFIVACLTAGVLAFLGAVVLDNYQRPAELAYSTDSVRL